MDQRSQNIGCYGHEINLLSNNLSQGPEDGKKEAAEMVTA